MRHPMDELIHKAARPRRRQIPDGTPGNGVGNAEPTPTAGEVMDAAMRRAARQRR